MSDNEEYELTPAGQRYVSSIAHLGATETKAIQDFKKSSPEKQAELLRAGMVRKKR